MKKLLHISVIGSFLLLTSVILLGCANASTRTGEPGRTGNPATSNPEPGRTDNPATSNPGAGNPDPLPAAQAVTCSNNSPNPVASVQDLVNIGFDETSLSCNYQLTTDIDLSAYLWEPIGSKDRPFIGSLGGNDKTISGLRINKPDTDYVGLFSQIGVRAVLITYSPITDLTIIVHDTGIIGRGNNRGGVGALAGHSYANISNVKVSGGKVTGDERVGGLVGSHRGRLENSSTSVDVKGKLRVGGLVGDQSEGSINDSFATGMVQGEKETGGLTGRISLTTITSSYATGDVEGNERIGGLVGYQIFSLGIYSSYATGDVEGNEKIGGLVGENTSTISSSFATGAVRGTTEVGGLIGSHSGSDNDPGKTSGVNNAFATGTVTGTNNVGGLIGVQRGFLLSLSPPPITNNTYATGAVIGNNQVGGLVGSQSAGSIRNSYYDAATTGQRQGNGNNPDTIGEISAYYRMDDEIVREANSTEETVLNEDSFSGWDFTDTWQWWADGQWPIFKWQALPATPAPIAPSPPIPGSYQLVFGDIDGDDTMEMAYVEQQDNSDNVTITLYETLSDAQDRRNATITWAVEKVGRIWSGGYLDKDTIVIHTGENDRRIYATTITVDFMTNPATTSLVKNTDNSLSFFVDLDQAGVDDLLTVAKDKLPAADLDENLYAAAELTKDSVATLARYNKITDRLSFYEKRGEQYFLLPDAPKPAVGLKTLIGSQDEIYGLGFYYADTTSLEKLVIYNETAIYEKDLSDVLARLPLPAAKAITTPAANAAVPIRNVQDLRSIDYDDASRGYDYQLATDIDLRSTGLNSISEYVAWEPIGTEAAPFLGNFDGQNNTISGLHINKPDTDYVGLFVQIGSNIDTAPEVKTLRITIHEVITGKEAVGALAGTSYATIRNVQVSGGLVKGIKAVGGLVGYQIEGSIENSYATGDVEGNSNVGGLVGYQIEGSITNSYATGTVGGNWGVGSLVGFPLDSIITNSYYDAATTGQRQGRGNTADAPGEVSAYYTKNGVVRTTDANDGDQIQQSDFDGWDFSGANGKEPAWRWVEDGKWPILKQQWDLQNPTP